MLPTPGSRSIVGRSQEAEDITPLLKHHGCKIQGLLLPSSQESQPTGGEGSHNHHCLPDLLSSGISRDYWGKRYAVHSCSWWQTNGRDCLLHSAASQVTRPHHHHTAQHTWMRPTLKAGIHVFWFTIQCHSKTFLMKTQRQLQNDSLRGLLGCCSL